MKKSTKLSAFTLIELLIVIAIIGILAALMAGGISVAMESAKATTIGNNGRNIVQAILQTNNDRIAASLSELWPSASGQGTAVLSDSNAYFVRLMQKNLIEGIAYADFAGGGVAAAKDDTELKEKGNVWNVLAGIGVLDAYAPFIWTRNLSKGSNKGFSEATFEESDGTDMKEMLDGTVNPFGDKRVVLVRKGGAMQNIKSSLLNTTTFLGGGSNVVEKIAILDAKSESESTGGNDWESD